MQKQELGFSAVAGRAERTALQAAGKAEESGKKNPELQRKTEDWQEIRKIQDRLKRILMIETLRQKAEKLGEELEKVQKKCQGAYYKKRAKENWIVLELWRQ